MAAYSEQIVWAPSEDQRAQAGVLMRPVRGAVRPIGIVCIHGTAAFFYWPLEIYIGRALAQRGYRFVSGNTRRHDMVSYDIPWSATISLRRETFAEFRLGGEGIARPDEEPHDVAGWITFLAAQGAEQFVLFGYSGGVRRVTYYQAERQDPRVVGLILASGHDRVTARDPASLELAERLVSEGHGDTLLPVPEDDPFAIESAAYVIHWQRHAGRFAAEGHEPWIAGIRVPVLATLGTVEFNPDLRAHVEDMRGRAVQAPRFDIHVFEGADHNYTGHERELAEVVAGWLATLPATRGATPRRWWSGRKRTH